MNFVTSAVFDLHHSASYFLYTLKVHKKNSLERKRWWRTPRLCTLHTQALTCYARCSHEVSGHLVSFPATLWVVWPGRKNRWRKGVDIWDLVGAFSWRRSSVPKRKGKQKKKLCTDLKDENTRSNYIRSKIFQGVKINSWQFTEY